MLLHPRSIRLSILVASLWVRWKSSVRSRILWKRTCHGVFKYTNTNPACCNAKASFSKRTSSTTKLATPEDSYFLSNALFLLFYYFHFLYNFAVVYRFVIDQTTDPMGLGKRVFRFLHSNALFLLFYYFHFLYNFAVVYRFVIDQTTDP